MLLSAYSRSGEKRWNFVPWFPAPTSMCSPRFVAVEVREEKEITEVPGRLPQAAWQVWPARRVESGGATISTRMNCSRTTAETRTSSAKNVLLRVAKSGCRNSRAWRPGSVSQATRGVGPHRAPEAQNQLDRVLASLRFSFLGGAIGLVEPPDGVAEIGVAE